MYWAPYVLYARVIIVISMWFFISVFLTNEWKSFTSFRYSVNQPKQNKFSLWFRLSKWTNKCESAANVCAAFLRFRTPTWSDSTAKLADALLNTWSHQWNVNCSPSLWPTWMRSKHMASKIWNNQLLLLPYTWIIKQYILHIRYNNHFVVFTRLGWFYTYYMNRWQEAIILTPPLSHFTLTLIASEMPFSALPRPLPIKVTWQQQLVNQYPPIEASTLIYLISPCSQPWRRSCCSANFSPRLFSSAVCDIVLVTRKIQNYFLLPR